MPEPIRHLALSLGDFVYNAAGSDYQDSPLFTIFGRTMLGYMMMIAVAIAMAGTFVTRYGRR